MYVYAQVEKLVTTQVPFFVWVTYTEHAYILGQSGSQMPEHRHIHTLIHTYIYVHTCVHICTYVRTYIHICAYVHTLNTGLASSCTESMWVMLFSWSTVKLSVMWEHAYIQLIRIHMYSRESTYTYIIHTYLIKIRIRIWTYMYTNRYVYMYVHVYVRTCVYNAGKVRTAWKLGKSTICNLVHNIYVLHQCRGSSPHLGLNIPAFFWTTSNKVSQKSQVPSLWSMHVRSVHF